MVRQKSGVIINMGSIAGIEPQQVRLRMEVVRLPYYYDPMFGERIGASWN